MSAFITAYGRLAADPELRQSASGKSWCTARIAIDAGRERGAATIWAKVIAFGQAAEALVGHAKGDMISVMGRLQLAQWEDREGNRREGLEVVADALLSARTARPSGKRKAEPDQERQAPRAGSAALDDEIPF